MIKFSVSAIFFDGYVKIIMSLFKLLSAEIYVTDVEINLSVIGIVLNSFLVFNKRSLRLLQIKKSKTFIVKIKRQCLLLGTMRVVLSGILLMLNGGSVSLHSIFVLAKFVIGQS